MLALQFEKDATAVGRDLHHAGGRLIWRSTFARYFNVSPAVVAVEPDGNEALLGCQINSFRIIREMRESSALRRSDVYRRSATRRNVPQIGAGRTTKARDLTGGGRVVQDLFFRRIGRMVAANIRIKLVVHCTGDKDDLRTVRRIRRIRIERRRIGQPFGVAAIWRDRVDIAAIGRPCDIRDRAAVGRPRGHELTFAAGRHTTRRPRGQVHYIQLAKRRERHPFAVGRDRRITY